MLYGHLLARQACARLVLLRLHVAEPDCHSCHCARAQMSAAAGLHIVVTGLVLSMAQSCCQCNITPAPAAVLHQGNMHAQALTIARLEVA